MADLRQGMELGADDYLTKPCTVEQFLAAITVRLKRREELSWRCEPMTQPNCDVRIEQETPNPSSDHRPREQGNDDFFPHCPKLSVVFQFIEAHYQQPINLNDVAQEAGYSPAYLTNLVQEKTGRTVKRWIIERRMAQARQLLANTTQSIRYIAESSGYSDAGYFTRQFRQLHGASPQIWRQQFVANTTN